MIYRKPRVVLKTKTLSLGLRLLSACFLAVFINACSHTYPEDRLVEELRALCKREYGIDNIEVKIVGKTIGVHLPLLKLFAADFKSLASGAQKIENMEELLQFSPDATEKIENVLFSTSRVILSTDKPIDFYVLTATDMEITGIQLILVGYVDDLKRVRFWDISRDEYRKRIVNDLRINRGVVWKQTVVNFFRDMEKNSLSDLLGKYFTSDASPEEISPLFYSELLELGFKHDVKNEIIEVKSTSLKPDEVVVYAKVRQTFKPVLEYVNYDFLIPSGYEAEYIFTLRLEGDEYKISRVIPFHYLNDKDKMSRVEFPEELGLYKNINTWLEDFTLEEVFLPDFLAEQVTRRVNQMLGEDAEVVKHFDDVRLEFAHIREEKEGEVESNSGAKAVGQAKIPSHFRLTAVLMPKGDHDAKGPTGKSLFAEQDVRYLLNKALIEFLQVLRSYRFEDFEYLDIVSPAEHEVLMLGKNELELFRQKKLPLVDLLKSVYPL